MAEVRVLGPLELVGADGPVPLAATKHRRLLAALVVAGGRTCSTDALVDALWPDEPPRSARKLLQVYVSQLRKALPPDAVRTDPGGYALRLDADAVDAVRFERLAADGAAALAAGDAMLAATLAEQALALWRGPAYAEVAYDDFARGEAERLEELRLAVVEQRLEAQLQLGRHAEATPELLALTQEHVHRERLHRLAMLALYRAGRQVDALALHAQLRARLRDELGLEPGPELRDLQLRILRQDESLAQDAPAAGGGARLPTPATRLVGRAVELAALRALLLRDDVRLVVLTGAGGSGKTRLALEAARAAAPSFAQGAALVELAPLRDAALVAPTIADALDVRIGPGDTPLDAVAAALRTREFLLVVDNAEHVRDAAPLFVELLARAPRLTLLVTSRAVLHLSGEHVFPVPPLPEDDALELFAQRARALEPNFRVTAANEPELREICRRVDGLPLAVELAAGRIRTLTPGALLMRLASRLTLLTGGARDLPARQQTLRETIDWSVNLLDERERAALTRLAVFAGGASLDAAETVCGADVETLAALVDEHLVRRTDAGGEPRYGLLETIREYALQLLGDERPAVEAALAVHVRRLVEAAELRGVEQGRWLACLDVEVDNVRAALDVAVAGGDTETELALLAVLWRYWWIRGHLVEGRGRLEPALSRTDGTSTPVRLRVLYGAAGLAWAAGALPRARALATELLAAARGAGSAADELAAHNVLGNVALNERAFEEATDHFRRAIALAEQTRSEIDAITAKLNVGVVSIHAGDPAAAVPVLEEVLAHHRRERIVEGVGFACLNLGQAAYRLGDRSVARERFGEAQAAFAKIGFRAHVGHALQGLAAVAAGDGRLEDAARLLGRADRELRDVGASPEDFDPELVAEAEAAARSGLGDDAFSSAFAAGVDAV